MKIALENIDAITSLGDLPLRYARDLLKNIRSAAQLRQWEETSGDIYDETEQHWKRLIKTDFSILSAQYDFGPKDREFWHEVYDKYKAIQAKQDAEATEKLQQSFAVHKKEQESRRVTVLNPADLKKLPNPKNTRTRFNSPAPSREKKTFLQKTKNEVAAESKRFHLPSASGKLPVAAGQIKKAPEVMVRDLRTAKMYDPRLGHGNSPGQTSSIQSKRDHERELKEREARLTKLKNPETFDSFTPGNKSTAGNKPPTRQAKPLAKDARLFGDDEDNDASLFSEDEDEDDNKRVTARLPSDWDIRPTVQISKPTGPPTPKPLAKPRRGLLSAAPGANKLTTVRTSPPLGTAATTTGAGSTFTKRSPPSPPPGAAKTTTTSAAAIINRPSPPRDLPVAPPPPPAPSVLEQPQAPGDRPVVHLKRRDPKDMVLRPNKRAKR